MEFYFNGKKRIACSYLKKFPISIIMYQFVSNMFLSNKKETKIQSYRSQILLEFYT